MITTVLETLKLIILLLIIIYAILADTKEEAEEIAKTRASEDIDYNNCDCEVDNMSVWYSFKED